MWDLSNVRLLQDFNEFEVRHYALTCDSVALAQLSKQPKFRRGKVL